MIRPTLAAAVICVGSATGAALAGESVDWSRADAIAAAIERPHIPVRRVAITRFGAVPGGRHDARPAIQDAIAAQSRHGGGHVVVPRGLWFVKGPIVLESRIDLRLDKGAVLRFSADPADFLPPVKIRWEGIEILGHAPLIYGRDVEDVSITGPGVLDGNAKSAFLTWETPSQPDIARARRMAFEDTPFDQRVFGDGTHLRPSAVEIVGGKRVLLQGYTVRNASFWVNHLVYVDHAVVRGIRVESRKGEAQEHNDGLDIDSSTNVLVEKAVFRCGNYSVAIKSGRDADARRIGRPSSDIVIRNNDLGCGDGIGFGSEMSGGIRNVYIRHNVMRNAGAAFHFKSNLQRGGTIENVHVRDMTMGRYHQFLWLQFGQKGEMGDSGHPPVVRNISFQRLKAQAAEDALIIDGPEASPASDIIFDHVSVKAGKASWALKNAANVEFRDVVFGAAKLNQSIDKQ